MKPRITLDTNVCSIIAGSPNRSVIEKTIRDRFKVVASANTLLELLRRFAKSTSDDYFERDREAFAVAVGSPKLENATILDSPVEFALYRVCGDQCVDFGKSVRNYRRLLKTVRKAQSLSDLLSNRVSLGIGTTRYGLNAAYVDDNVQRGIRWHTQTLIEAKEKQYVLDPPVVWAVNFALFNGLRITNGQGAALAASLDAVYEYQRVIWQMASKGGYKPEKPERAGDWLDMNQLFYLCDPQVYFLTDERGIKDRCRKSQQSERIIVYSDFMEDLLLS